MNDISYRSIDFLLAIMRVIYRWRSCLPSMCK